jgi:hypothetical protein
MNTQKIIPMINTPSGKFILSLPKDRLSRLFGIGLFLLLFTSCSSIHKLANKKVAKDVTTDKSVTNSNTYTQSITTEKTDTLIKIKADTAHLNLFIPDIVPSPLGEGVGDEAAGTDEAQKKKQPAEVIQFLDGGNIQLSLKSTPVYTNGIQTGTQITATAIKKADSINVKIDKTTITNSHEQTQTKKDITQKKVEKQVQKDVTKKRFNIAGMLCTFGIILLILLAVYYYLKKRNQ